MHFFFFALSIIMILGALAAVTLRNPIHAALASTPLFVAVAGIYILLHAEFLAAVQVLVYVGAIATLILFAIMLTRDIEGEKTRRSISPSTQLVAAIFIAPLLLVLMLYGIRQQPGLGKRMPDLTLEQIDSDTWRHVVETQTKEATRQGHASAFTIENVQQAFLDGDAAIMRQVYRTHYGSARLGKVLMTDYVVPFEVVSVLLTAALVGAVVIAMEDKGKQRAAVRGKGEEPSL